MRGFMECFFLLGSGDAFKFTLFFIGPCWSCLAGVCFLASHLARPDVLTWLHGLPSGHPHRWGWRGGHGSFGCLHSSSQTCAAILLGCCDSVPLMVQTQLCLPLHHPQLPPLAEQLVPDKVHLKNQSAFKLDESPRLSITNLSG